MFKKMSVLLVLPLITVAANSSSPEPEPGLYEVTAGISSQELSGEIVEESVEQCVTKEDLEADPRKILGEHAGMEGCTISDYDWADGKISMKMKCALEGYKATSESTGTYDAAGYEMISVMKMQIEDQTIQVKSFVRGKRIGDC